MSKIKIFFKEGGAIEGIKFRLLDNAVYLKETESPHLTVIPMASIRLMVINDKDMSLDFEDNAR
jgi:hypothetical protein